MRSRLACIVAPGALTCIGALALLACSGGGGPGSLEGTLVFNLPPGLPGVSLEGHTIEIDGPDLRTTTTAEDGSYVFTDLVPGDYIVRPQLGLWSQETQVQASVEVVPGELSHVPELRLTPAGIVQGTVSVVGGASAEGFRCQILGTGLAAVAGANGAFVIYRVPGMLEGGYELLVERADVGSARRAGILVTPFAVSDIGTIEVTPGGSGTANGHPAFTQDRIQFINNGTRLTQEAVPLPYRLPQGATRRFDRVALWAPATDPDGDPLSYEWSASAGKLIDPLTPEPRWQPDAYAGSAATVSVTIRDGHGGIARMSTDVTIRDVFAGSAHRSGNRVVHSYRVEGGPWQVDVVTLGYVDGTDDAGRPIIVEDRVQPVVSLTQSSDPRPLLFTSHVVVRQEGELVRYDLTGDNPTPLGYVPVLDTVTQPSTAATLAELWVITEGSPEQVQSLQVSSLNAGPSLSCGGVCLGLASDGLTVAAINNHGDFITAGHPTLLAGAQLDRGFSWGGGRLAFVEGGGGSSRNTLSMLEPGSGSSLVYNGYYSMLVGAHAGKNVLITEQEYRSLRHPPFIRWLRAGAGWMGDFPWRSDGWMADRVYHLQDNVALVRRVTRSDWPEPFDQSRSEIVRVRLPEAFGGEATP